MMKRILSALLVCCALFLLCPGQVFAADPSRSYDFDLTINGSHDVTAQPGDVLTVTLTLHRTDRQEAADVYAMQDEIRYDDEFFEIVPGGSLLANGIASTDIALQGGDRAFYLNFVSMQGGESWQADTLVGTFQVKVLATSGASTLRSENHLVSLPDGSDSYAVTSQDVTVTVSSDCTVHFDAQGGSSVDDQTVPLGSKLTKPKDPTKDGYVLSGWYRDPDLKTAWDFEKDTVQGNMTLYAGWKTATANGSQTKTGEGTLWYLWVLLALLAALTLFALLRPKKRKQTQ